MNQALDQVPMDRAELLRRRLEKQAEQAMKRGEDGIKRRVAVRSPQGGYRLEVRVIKSAA